MIALPLAREGGLDPARELEFPLVERRPVIGLAYVKRDHRSAFPVGGLLVLTLGSLWFFENVGGGGGDGGGYKGSGCITYDVHRELRE